MEWFKANMSVEEDTAFIYAVNLYDTQENIADLVEFLSGDGTVNYNGGVDWAAKRKALGLEKPVNIMAYELGNELSTPEAKVLGILTDILRRAENNSNH